MDCIPIQVSDINPGVAGSSPGAFVVVGEYLYFTGYNGTSYYVYRSDGSTAERVPFPVGADQYVSCDCYTTNLTAVGGHPGDVGGRCGAAPTRWGRAALEGIRSHELPP